MQLNRVTKILLPILIIVLLITNIYLLINRFNYVTDYEDEIKYVENNTLSDFETEQNNFKQFTYTPNPDFGSFDYDLMSNFTAHSNEELEALRNKTQDIVLDSSFIDSLPDLSEFNTTAIMLPFRYSDYFDYSIYKNSSPELQDDWNFDVLEATYDYLYLDIRYTTDQMILPGPLTKLDLIERAVGYLKSKGIDPNRVTLSIDARYYVWEDRFFESNAVMNYEDIVPNATLVSVEDFTKEYPGITPIGGLTEEFTNPENDSYIAVSLNQDLNEVVDLAKYLGLRGIMVRYG